MNDPVLVPSLFAPDLDPEARRRRGRALVGLSSVLSVATVVLAWRAGLTPPVVWLALPVVAAAWWGEAVHGLVAGAIALVSMVAAGLGPTAGLGAAIGNAAAIGALAMVAVGASRADRARRVRPVGPPIAPAGGPANATDEHAAEALAQREAHYRAVIETSVDGFWMLDLEGRILEVNDAYSRLSGYARADLLTMEIGDLDTQETRRDTRERIDAIVKAGAALFEARHRRRDGTSWQVEINASYCALDGGRILVFLRDVFGRQRSEVLLRNRLELSGLAQTGTVPDLLRAALDAAERHTASGAGFFHFVEGHDTFVLQGWSTSAREQGVDEGRRGTRLPRGALGCCERVLRDRAPHSDQVEGACPALPGVPPGLHRRLVVPLLRGGEVVAVVGLLQKATPYDGGDIAVVQELASVAMDLADRKRAQEALRQSEERHRALVETTFDWIWEIDALGRYTYASDKISEILGFSPAEMLGHTPFDFMPPAEAARLKAVFASYLTTPRPFAGLENANVHRSGRRLVLETSGVPVFDDAGVFRGYRGSDRDITERKRAEEALRLSDERFRELAGSISEVFWLESPGDGTVVYVSPTYEAMWGHSCESVYASPRAWMDVVHPEDRPRVERTVDEWKARGTYEAEFRIVRPGGETRWMRDRAFPVRDADGHLVRIARITEDVTEKRRLEAQFLQTQKMESIGKLASGVAHDFNNWLTVISGCNAMLAGDLPPDDPNRGLLDEMSEAVDRAASLTRQLLAFSRQQVLEPRVLDLNVVVSDTQKMLRRLLGEDVVLATQLHPALSRVKVDPGHLVQVLMNLAVNARDAMPKGGRLSIATANVDLDATFARVPPGAHGQRYVMLAMTDTGTGMAPDVLARAFEPFFSTKGPGKGTGLGLSVVHGIVEQSGGRIEVESTLGAGATFRVYLPAVDEVEGTTTARPHAAGARGTETILLVEDEEGVRRVASRALRAAGYVVLQAGDGEEALGLLDSHPGRVDILVTDVVMPRMDGRELAEAVGRRARDIRVLYTSGYTDDAIVRHGVSAAEVAFLQKPYTPVSLLRQVRAVLDRK